jgi:hypothetical protein
VRYAIRSAAGFLYRRGGRGAEDWGPHLEHAVTFGTKTDAIELVERLRARDWVGLHIVEIKT